MPRDTKHTTSQGQDSKKKQTKSTRKQDEVVWGGFINIRLTDENKADFERWFIAEQIRIWQYVEDALAQNLKISFSWDSENECYISSFIGAGVDGSNERYCLPARSNRLDESIALLVYKHVVICDCDWGGYMPRTGTVNNWG